MSSNESNQSVGGSGNFNIALFAIPAIIAAIVLLVTTFVLRAQHDASDTTRTVQTAFGTIQATPVTPSAQATVRREAAPAMQEPLGTVCRPFGKDERRTCELGTQGSDWIPPELVGGESLEGYVFCWTDFAGRVEYLRLNGHPGTYDPASPPTDAMAYRFIPEQPNTTVSYRMAQQCNTGAPATRQAEAGNDSAPASAT